MTDVSLEKLRSIIERESGIKLGPEKTELLLNRVRKRLRVLGVPSEREYLKILETDLSGEELVELLDVISTNHTFFYREPQHFTILSELLARHRREGRSEVKIWCAASSSGEEPYTLSMLCEEAFAGSSAQAKILATDISTRILRKAIAAEYEEKQLEKMPRDLVTRYFEPFRDEEGAKYRVVREIRDRVHFRRLNLSKFPFPLSGPIDIIFCRNVMIYFDLPLRRQIVAEMSRLLAPGGVLFLSHSENLLGIDHDLTSFEVGAYKKGGGL